MKNQRGITLVELLATLAIAGIITVLIVSVLSTGTNATHRTTMKQHLQQEANYIVEVIRSEYLKIDNPEIQLEVEGTGNQQKLKMGSEIISQGYTYSLISPAAGSINPEEDTIFQLELSAPGTKPYTIKTKFSKLR
ncbi:PilW family protein [Planococcus shixiaomingii]|uniref:PilW family protein n=1 Tax=Planococcus shixiaomingii TaxID=3058393 RepID=UPI002612E4D3|nr:type II secretion system protein [Planococcus sp. N022]WKA56194.1 type II secretion system protein [Planococcus sp. N022]